MKYPTRPKYANARPPRPGDRAARFRRPRRPTDPYAMGQACFLAGGDLSANPFDEETDHLNAMLWSDGFQFFAADVPF